MGASDHSINWGACRENALFQLQRFESLPRAGPALIRSYQAVLDRDETFTQYFSDEHLESYDAEANLRNQIGIPPPCLSDPEDPGSESEVILSWVNIIRHGDFEKQPDGSFLCRAQGKIVEIDESLHKAIGMLRSMLPITCPVWPSPADVDRESEISLAIEADVLEELNNQIKYVERLKRLQLSLKRRRNRLQEICGPSRSRALVKKERTPQRLRPQYSTPADSHPAALLESHDTRARSSSESSDVSTGDDIPFTGDRKGSKSMSFDSSDDSSDDDSEQNSNAHIGNNRNQVNGKEGPVNTNQEIILIDGDSSAPSTQILPTNHSRKNTPTDKLPSVKRSLQEADDEDLTQPPSKKQKSENGTSPVNPEALNFDKEPPMSSEQPEESLELQHQTPNQQKKPQRKKRMRNNFTHYEKEHAPAWLRSQIDAEKTPTEIELAYVERFRVKHHFYTLKQWLCRMEESAKKVEKQQEKPTNGSRPESKIVILKTTPFRTTFSPHGHIVPATVVSDPGSTPPPYVSPYPPPDYRVSEEPRASSASYSLDWPPRAATLGGTPIKSGLPNV